MKFFTPLLLLCSSLSLTALSLLPCPAMAQRHSAGEAQVKTVHALPATATSGVTLRMLPAMITLRNPYEECRALVETGNQKEPQDVSGKAELRLLDTRIAAVDENGIVRPKRDGKTFLIARLQGREARVPVVVSGMKNAPAPRFVTDVMPVLTHAGCNQGACHGAASGKGGFKLSLLGYDPDADYLAITRANRARRVSVAQPEQSLLLRKPVLAVYHKGGKRFMEGSTEYSIVRDWIAAGLPAPNAKEQAITKLEVTPPLRTIPINGAQRFAVTAMYADGSKRDVTTETLFSASDETVATVTPSGEAKVTGNGEGAIIVRYQGLVGTARVVSPYGLSLENRKGEKERRRNGEAKIVSSSLSVSSTLNPQLSTIDRLVNAKLTALGLEASPHCTDSDFLRRAYLDVTGCIPTAEQARAFLTDTSKDKRDKLVDALLASPEYVDFWTLKWGDILRCSRQKLATKGMYAYHDWIRQSVADNKPWDQMARELVLAQGSAFKNGAANYYRTAAGPQELAETTSEIFLGVRIACARCHNHPYEKWTQNQYYQMAAFFARVGSKPGERAGEPVIVAVAAGEVRHPKTQQVVMPCALDARAVPDAEGQDRRQALADWLTSGQNPFFAHAVVNRVWKHYMGMGFVEPVDDLRATNPPSNAALYDWLAQDLAQNHFDLKRLMRNILRSEAYQRSPDATRNNLRDSRYYSHFAFKRLSAEQMLDAIAGVTGVGDKFDGYPMGTRAGELPDTGVASYFLDLFGRPARSITCECERSDMPTLGQMLHLMNDVGLNARLSSKTGRVTALLEAKTPDTKLVEEMYLSALSRFPTTEERTRAVKALAASLPANRQKTAEDLLWALLNSKEFVFNH